MLLQLFTPICWRALEVALVGEIEIGARAEATAVGDIGDGQGDVAQQVIDHAHLIGLSEIDATHICEQEYERINVTDAGTVALTEGCNARLALRQVAQKLIHDVDAHRLQVSLQWHIRHVAVLAIATAVDERRYIEVVDSELRLAY